MVCVSLRALSYFDNRARRPPSEKQLQYAQALAAKKGINIETIANRLETEKVQGLLLSIGMRF